MRTNLSTALLWYEIFAYMLNGREVQSSVQVINLDKTNSMKTLTDKNNTSPISDIVLVNAGSKVCSNSAAKVVKIIFPFQNAMKPSVKPAKIPKVAIWKPEKKA